MTSARSAHDEFDRDLACLYHGLLKGIMRLGPLLVNFEVSEELVWEIARCGAWFNMAPFYECEIIELNEKGLYYRRADDGDRDVEP